jgi:hypothetical protein
MMENFGKIILVLGVVLVVVGAVLWGIGKLTGGRMLPGDIVVERPGFTFAFPIVTSIILSILLTLILWIVAAIRR